MQGIDATFDGAPFGDGRDFRKVVLHAAFGAAALASAGCLAFLLHQRLTASPEVVAPPPVKAPASAAEDFVRLFGQIVIEPDWARPASEPQLEARLEAAPPSGAIPLPSLDAFPPLPPERPTPSASAEPTLPPAPDVATLEEIPLPPPRPPEFAAPPKPERRAALSAAQPPAPVDNRNMFQKFLSWGLPSWPVGPAPSVASRPAVAPAPVVASRPADTPARTDAPAQSQEGRTGRGWFASLMPGNPTTNYDRFTAIYDISARAVYLPDGSRLEAHSGLGERLDDPRYVSERARGATPPHLYELTMRESLFHGVQALRLNPVGDGDLFGRAGLLAHPYMLGPNGDSNGCVSVKEYEAFLRAYQNGQIKRLAVVSRL